MRTYGGRPWQPSDRRSGEITVSSSRWRLRAHGEGMRVQHQQPRYRNRGSHGLKRNARGEPHGCIDEGGSPQNGNSTIPARKPCGWTLSDVAVRTGCVGSTSETGLASRRGGKAFRSQTLYGPFVDAVLWTQRFFFIRKYLYKGAFLSCSASNHPNQTVKTVKLYCE